MNDIKTLQKEVHKNAKHHGWWDERRSFAELIALIHSELSEALECYRDPNFRINQNQYESDNKPIGIPSELADVVIRVMDLCEYFGIDLESAIIEKHQYNKTRTYKHGGKVI